MNHHITRNGLLAIALLTLLTTTLMPTTSEAGCRRWQSLNYARYTTLYRGVTYWIRSSRGRITIYDGNGYYIRRGWNVPVRPRWTGTFRIYGRHTSIRICW
jgi:hypothetical protein